MTAKTTFVSFLLDETGSMASIADDTVKGFNTYLETLQGSNADIVLSLVSFNSNETLKRHVAEPVDRVPPLERREYRPNAMTPLIDAAVKIIKATDEAVRHRGDDPNVVIVMQTDGLENVSVEYTTVDLAALVKEKTEAGWEFVFLGAGLDAFDAAQRAGLHLHPEQVVSYSRARSHEVFSSTAENLSDYAESGDSMSLSYTPQQRKSVGDGWFGRGRGPKKGRTGKERSREKPVDDFDLSKR